MASRGSTFATSMTFGLLLRQLRKRAGMTQRDLAAALGYSDSLISSLEKGQRQPDPDMVRAHFIPALGLQDDPRSAAHLLECAAIARGERPPMMRHLPSAPKPRYADRPRAVHRLPALPIELIGRNEIVQQLSNRLLGHGGRLLTLVGPPGVGKTTLALAVATQVQQHYPDGAHFIPMAAHNDSTLMAAAIVATVAPGDNSNKPPQTRVIELLRPQATLLVLDNLEQITGAASLIATLLAECPPLTILATSRERLHLRSEQRFKVPPLDLTAAIGLFVQRAQAVDGGFRLTDQNRAIVAAICARLDCLPLALELCAAQIELFSPVQLLAELQARPLDLLVDGAHDLPPQQRTLRQAIQRSYELLGIEEQMLFRRLGGFVGGFDLAAVEAISALQNSNDILRSLIGKSLVRAETLANGEQRFFLLETIREFALEQLCAHDEKEIAQQSHACYFYEIARRPSVETSQALKGKFYQQMEPDYPNLRAALRWLLDHQRYDGLCMANALEGFWWARGYHEEGQNWLHSALTANSALSLERAKAWLGLANLSHIHSARLEREQYANNALQICQQLGDETLLAACYRQLGLSKYVALQLTEAEKFFRLGWDIGQKGELTPLKVELRSLVARLQKNLGFYTDAVRAELEAALIDAQALGDAAITARAATGLSSFDFERKDYTRAAISAALALLFAHESQDKHAMGMAESYAGDVALVQGNLALARRHYHDSLQYFTEIGAHFNRPIWRLGWLAEIEMRYAEAQVLYQQALQGCVAHHDQRYRLRSLLGLASVTLAQGATATAHQWFTAARELIECAPLLLTSHDHVAYQRLLTQLELKTYDS